VAPIEKVGRVEAPRVADNRLEVVFGDPLCLKTLFTYFKNLKVREIYIRCTRGGLYFLARDMSRKSRIVGSAPAEHSHWFYCEEEFDLHLNRETAEKVFAAIDKSYHKLTLYQSRDDRDNLNLMLHNIVSGSQKLFLIHLSDFGPDEELMAALGQVALPEAKLTEHYPLSFALDAKSFKKVVTDALNFSAQLTIDAAPGLPLRFSSASSGISVSEAFLDSDKISLRLAQAEPVQITVKAANLRPLASSMVADTIRIHCRAHGDLLFASELAEKALTVHALTGVD
jgi:hypothetical protein